jgi:membrane protein required for colicin V production
MNSFDYLILVLLVFSAFSGFKAGLIQMIFKAIGYIAGGVTGVAVAIDYLDSLYSEIYLLGGLILSVIIFALVGEFLLGRLGILFRKALFIPPFKFIDSALGGALSVIKFGVIAYLISTILVASPIALADKYITPSKSYIYADTHLPKVAKDLKQEVAQLFNKLT